MTLVSKVVLANYPIPYVDFFANGMQIARVPDPPYIFKWEGMAPGTYELTASTKYGETLFSAPPVSIVVADVALNIERPSDHTLSGVSAGDAAGDG